MTRRTWIRFPDVRGFTEGERAYLNQGIGFKCGGQGSRDATCSNGVAYRCKFQYHHQNRPPVHVRKSPCAACARAWVVWVDVETAKNVPDVDCKIETLPELEYEDRQQSLFSASHDSRRPAVGARMRGKNQ